MARYLSDAQEKSFGRIRPAIYKRFIIARQRLHGQAAEEFLF